MRIRRLAPILAAAALGAACSSAEDQAAKARIFSPEDPPRVLQAAAEQLASGELGNDPQLVERVFAISAQEAAARLGPHQQNARVEFRWSRDGKTVDLSEERLVALGRNGDFHVRIENDQDQGMEWVKSRGISYARNRYARFRERRRDRGSSEHVVASAYATLATFRDWVHGAMKLTPAGTTTVGTRRAVKYNVTLGEPRKHTGDERLPEVVFPKGGPDDDTRLRLTALEQARPQTVTGVLLVDEETAVPLKADLEAAVVVPSEKGQSRLELSVRLDVKNVGKEGLVVVPDHIEDAPRPPGVVATLKAYGIPRAAEAAEGEEAKPAGNGD